MTYPPVTMVDLERQRQRIAGGIDAAIRRVLAHGQFILGPEVEELERQLAAYAGVDHCITCANGTDAITLTLMAEGVGPGDAVFIPAFTFVATAEAVRLAGATPLFCDVLADTFCLDPESLAAAIPFAQSLGLTPRAVIPVDLFGQPADYRAISEVTDRPGLTVIADAAQSFGAGLDNRRVGQFGKAATTSFFPAKPLGCYGDGGAILTSDPELADLLRSLRFHGKSKHKYDNVRVGLNSRLDTLQAAILLQKLSIFDDEIGRRQRIADHYAAGLNMHRTPRVLPGAWSVWAQYTLLHDNRDTLARRAREAGVATAIYYPLPLSRQGGYRNFPIAPAGVPVSERLSEQVISLPMHPYLTAEELDRVIEVIASFRPA